MKQEKIEFPVYNLKDLLSWGIDLLSNEIENASFLDDLGGNEWEAEESIYDAKGN